MSEGYIKLYRKCLDNGWLRNPKLWVFWCWCLLKASYKDHDLLVGNQKVYLKSGDFVFGLKQASKELKMSIQSIRTCVNNLKTLQNITIKSTNKFSIISIINWDTYQHPLLENNNQTNTNLTHNQQATNNKQEGKEWKEKNKKDLLSESFGSFYQAYPKHDGKKKAFDSWQKLNPSPELIATILQSLEIQKQNPQWLKENGQFIPMPATWLNGRRWEDEGPQIKDWREW